jgi:hypothetical protein
MTTGQAALDRRRLPEAEARPANGMPQPRALEGARTETPHSSPRAARRRMRSSMRATSGRGQSS